ncbi:MAG: HTH-type transcriptional regulator RutR [Pantoea sp.]|uniref:HTH-type transcriptional regulator RutR n=1 Tax=Pantoea sp. TaxID=69393 RepID=UPI0023A7722B|nr:HTH-type transcriptional regulator RutR [Pantoea sp.]MDE1186849.1 HTH-type transcriptional regulator RutR [Pantoea sp.]
MTGAKKAAKPVTKRAAKRAAKPAAKRAAKPRAPARRSEAAISRRLKQIEVKRGAILAAALEVFSRYGLHGASLDQVAERADVSKSNLLYYFSDKEELYVAVLRDILTIWLAPLSDFGAERDPREAIGEYIEHKLAISRDHPAASRLFCLEMLQGAPLLRNELGMALRDMVERKSEVMREWAASGRLADVEPRHFLFMVWATTQHYADFAVQVEALTGRTLADPDFFAETVRNVKAAVLDGVLPRRG